MVDFDPDIDFRGDILNILYVRQRTEKGYREKARKIIRWSGFLCVLRIAIPLLPGPKGTLPGGGQDKKI